LLHFTIGGKNEKVEFMAKLSVFQVNWYFQLAEDKLDNPAKPAKPVTKSAAKPIKSVEKLTNKSTFTLAGEL
jgi:hypothetical protein